MDRGLNARTRNLGLTIPSLVVQLIRPPTILNSIKFARYYGTAGPVIFSLNITAAVSVFAFILLEMRIKAPGAKTFPQVLRSRFGKIAHIATVAIFLAAAIAGFLGVMMNGLDALITVSVKPNRERLIVYLFVTICSVITISQLGSFRVITSMMTLFILSMCAVLVFSVFQSTAHYPLVVWSEFLVNQANWSVGIALTPNQSSVGFILTSFAMFSIPFIFSTCLGLGFLALSSALGYDIIETTHYKNDMMPFVVPMFLFGRQGVIVAYVLIAILTAVSCSRNIVGVCTLIVYDVFEVYIKPFKRNMNPNNCVFCGKHRGYFSGGKTSCQCCSMLECADCNKDNQFMDKYKRCWNSPYTCRIHGRYREYRESIQHDGVVMLAFLLALLMPLISIIDEASYSSALCLVYLTT
ncbi:hypothetical protein SprV_0200717200 [Sparganum proliferum]